MGIQRKDKEEIMLRQIYTLQEKFQRPGNDPEQATKLEREYQRSKIKRKEP